ncbi:MAG: hypothetical protein Kapaf2KO_17160 [Candidatus Kapaibacteriales bacterium]
MVILVAGGSRKDTELNSVDMPYQQTISLKSNELKMSVSIFDESNYRINYADTSNLIAISSQNPLPVVSIKNLLTGNSESFTGPFDYPEFEFYQVKNDQWIFNWRPRFGDQISRSNYEVSIIDGDTDVATFSAGLIVEDVFALNNGSGNSLFGVVNDGFIASNDSFQQSPLNNPSPNFGQSPSPNVIINTSMVTLYPLSPKLETVASQNWENTVNFNGVKASEISGKIKLKSELPDNSLSYRIQNENSITVTGIAGYLTDTISVEYNSGDGIIARTSFRVIPIAFAQVDLPDQFFVGSRYVISPNIPREVALESESKLLNGNDIVASTTGNAKLYFVPQQSLSGSKLRFVRYINGQRVSISRPIEVVESKPTEIVSLQRSTGNDFIATIRVYGQHEGKKNELMKIEVIPNDAEYKNLYGNVSNCGEGCREEKIRITTKDGKTPVLSVTDSRGFKTSSR